MILKIQLPRNLRFDELDRLTPIKDHNPELKVQSPWRSLSDREILVVALYCDMASQYRDIYISEDRLKQALLSGGYAKHEGSEDLNDKGRLILDGKNYTFNRAVKKYELMQPYNPSEFIRAYHRTLKEFQGILDDPLTGKMDSKSFQAHFKLKADIMDSMVKYASNLTKTLDALGHEMGLLEDIEKDKETKSKSAVERRAEALEAEGDE